MVIERLHGLQTTSITLNDRFTMLASAAPDRVTVRQRRRSVGNYYNQNFNFRNRNFIEQIARRLEQQAKRQALRQRLGVPPGALRRFGSEGNLPVMWRSNSFGNLHQGQSMKNRLAWRHSNGNLNRSNSFSSLSGDRGGRPLRGFKRRGGGVRQLRGRFRAVYRNGRQNQGRVTWVPLQRARRGRGASVTRPARGQTVRGRGRGGINRNQTPKPVPTKEELDEQLDQYMAGSKSVLDRELDAYMKSAMELE